MSTDPRARLDEALRSAHAAFLPEASAKLLEERLAWGICALREPEKSDAWAFNVGGLPNLRFGSLRRTPALAAPLAGTPFELQRAFRLGNVASLPPAARPESAADRVRLFLERREYLEKAEEADVADPDPGQEVLLGLGLAAFASLDEAATEAVRYALRAAPRDWSPEGTPETWRASFESYPVLAREPVPGYAELSSPLGWSPGQGPSAAAHETVRKLHADWAGFRASGARLAPDVHEGWSDFLDDWREGKILPHDLGGRIEAEIVRAGTVRTKLAGVEPSSDQETGVEGTEDQRSLFEKLQSITFEKAMTALTLGAMMFAHLDKDEAPKALPPPATPGSPTS